MFHFYVFECLYIMNRVKIEKWRGGDKIEEKFEGFVILIEPFPWWIGLTMQGGGRIDLACTNIHPWLIKFKAAKSYNRNQKNELS